MSQDDDDIRRARRAYEQTANNPDVKPDHPPANAQPGSHSTGGARDHGEAGEGEPGAADKRHSSAPRMDRKDEPMITQARPALHTGRPGVDRDMRSGLPPDADT
jgi:hypothetical protein